MENQLVLSEKEKIIADSIGIRAGLSLISQCTDEIRKVNDILHSAKNDLRTQKGYFSEEDTEHSRLVCEINNKKREKRNLEASLSDAESAKNASNEKLKKEFKNQLDGEYSPDNYTFLDWFEWKIFWIFYGIGFLICAPLFSYLLEERHINYNWLFTMPLWGFLGTSAYAGFHYLDVRFISKSRCNLAKKKYYLRNVKKELRKKRDSLENKYNEVEASLKKCERELCSLEKAEIVSSGSLALKEANMNKKERELEQLQRESDTKIQALTEKAKSISAALKNAYGATLLESDWGNVDLVIHYIETGRADTLKEALYQVDRQIQNDKLVAAISEASRHISSHIESAFHRLGKALSESFNILNKNILSINSEVMNLQKEIRSENKAFFSDISGKLSQQIENSEINRALLEKSNKTSEDLLNDLRYNQRFWVK